MKSSTSSRYLDTQMIDPGHKGRVGALQMQIVIARKEYQGRLQEAGARAFAPFGRQYGVSRHLGSLRLQKC